MVGLEASCGLVVRFGSFSDPPALIKVVAIVESSRRRVRGGSGGGGGFIATVWERLCWSTSGDPSVLATASTVLAVSLIEDWPVSAMPAMM